MDHSTWYTINTPVGNFIIGASGSDKQMLQCMWVFRSTCGSDYIGCKQDKKKDKFVIRRINLFLSFQ